jgi:hypothetical protein
MARLFVSLWIHWFWNWCWRVFCIRRNCIFILIWTKKTSSCAKLKPVKPDIVCTVDFQKILHPVLHYLLGVGKVQFIEAWRKWKERICAKIPSFCFLFWCLEGKSLACAHDCKFIETSSGIQHNVDELLVGSLKQCRLRDEKSRKEIKTNKSKNKLHSSRTSLSLHLAKEILGKLCLQNSKSKSCENLHVL